MKINKPFFSIILPVYNRVEKVSVAIQSVLDQDFKQWELIVVDDFSTDMTARRVAKYSDSRINFVSNSANMGPAYSRNVGIKYANGDVICFLDSDDKYFSTFLSETFEVYKNGKINLGFVWTGLEVKYSEIIKKEIWSPSISISGYHTFLQTLKIGTNSGLSVKKVVFDKCGLFDDRLRAAEDTEFLLRIVQEFRFSVIQKPLIFIDKSGRDRLSKDYSKIAEAYNSFIPSHWGYISNYPDLRKKYTYKLMWLNYHLGDYSKARKNLKAVSKISFGALKAFLIAFGFEVFGRKLGARFHIFLSN